MHDANCLMYMYDGENSEKQVVIFTIQIFNRTNMTECTPIAIISAGAIKLNKNIPNHCDRLL